MALKAAYEIRCSCGAAFVGEVYEYVFVEHDPELKDAILSGEFNHVPCPSCGNRVHVENRFLYRDEMNNLWVWVCRTGEKTERADLARDLLERNTAIEGYFLDDQEAYRKFLVFGREALIELLLREDPVLKRAEGKRLKENPALHWIREQDDDPGYLFLRGDRIRVAMALRLPRKTRAGDRPKWLRSYAQGLNVHNPYSSFLDARRRRTWGRLQASEPLSDGRDEFDAFARAWARYRTDGKAFRAGFPGTCAFFDALRQAKITRPLRPLRVKEPRPDRKKKGYRNRSCSPEKDYGGVDGT